MPDLGILSYAGITVIAFFIGMIVKRSKLDSKWIPIICGCVGIACGILFFLVGVDDFPATDLPNAIAVGIVSGLTAVGLHQGYKQIADNKNTSNK